MSGANAYLQNLAAENFASQGAIIGFDGLTVVGPTNLISPLNATGGLTTTNATINNLVITGSITVPTGALVGYQGPTGAAGPVAGQPSQFIFNNNGQATGSFNALYFTGTSTGSNVYAGSSIIPSSTSVYNLGSPDHLWKSIYISTGTIFVGPTGTLGLDNNGVISSAAGFSTPFLTIGSTNPGDGIKLYNNNNLLWFQSQSGASGPVSIWNVASNSINNTYFTGGNIGIGFNNPTYPLTVKGVIYCEGLTGTNLPIGPQGAQGPQGYQGIQGPTGPQGPTGNGFTTISNYGNNRLLISTGTSANSAVAYSNLTYDGTKLSMPNIAVSNNEIWIGNSAGANSSSATGTNAVGIGRTAGQYNQGYAAVSLGYNAGTNLQGTSAVAIGPNSGNGGDNTTPTNGQGVSAVAIGDHSGWQSQGTNSVSMGTYSGYLQQGANSIAIGNYTAWHYQGINAVAIGPGAGYVSQGNYSVAIGNSAGNSNQAANSIVMNANSSALNATGSGFFVNPVNTYTQPGVMTYNPSTSEIAYSATTASIPNLTVTTMTGTTINANKINVGQGGIFFSTGSNTGCFIGGLNYNSSGANHYLYYNSQTNEIIQASPFYFFSYSTGVQIFTGANTFYPVGFDANNILYHSWNHTSKSSIFTGTFQSQTVLNIAYSLEFHSTEPASRQCAGCLYLDGTPILGSYRSDTVKDNGNEFTLTHDVIVIVQSGVHTLELRAAVENTSVQLGGVPNIPAPGNSYSSVTLRCTRVI